MSTAHFFHEMIQAQMSLYDSSTKVFKDVPAKQKINMLYEFLINKNLWSRNI